MIYTKIEIKKDLLDLCEINGLSLGEETINKIIDVLYNLSIKMNALGINLNHKHLLKIIEFRK